jgi:hypothetical protein
VNPVAVGKAFERVEPWKSVMIFHVRIFLMFSSNYSHLHSAIDFLPSFYHRIHTLIRYLTIKSSQAINFISNTKESHEKFTPTGSSRYPYHENSSSDSEEEILRRLKLQQSISLQSGQIARYGGFSSPLNQSINLDGFQPIPMDNGMSLTSSKPIKYSSSRTSSIYNSGHRYSGVSNNNGRDLLGQAERGKIGSHSSSCSSNSSVEASVESNMGLLNHEKKGNFLFFLAILSINF